MVRVIEIISRIGGARALLDSPLLVLSKRIGIAFVVLFLALFLFTHARSNFVSVICDGLCVIFQCDIK